MKAFLRARYVAGEQLQVHHLNASIVWPERLRLFLSFARFSDRESKNQSPANAKRFAGLSADRAFAISDSICDSRT